MDADVFRVHSEVERRHWWFIARRRILRRVVESVVPARAGGTIVEIGCGVGANVAAFHPDYRYIGYDPSPDAVAFATQQYPGVSFRAGSAAEAHGQLNAADLVLLTDVIEHVSDDRALLREVIEPMRPDAWLLVTVPAGMELWSPHDVALGHYRRYDTALLGRAFTGLPVAPRILTYFNARLYLPVRIVRWLTSRLRRSAGGEGTDFSMPPGPVNSLLQRVFAGEAEHVAVAGSGGRGYDRGVSILALLRRTGSVA